jgi:alpha-beta hydrolase superfamily lysophospholipase
MLLNTIVMTPLEHIPINSVICYCHGYTDNISYMKLLEFQRFVSRGIAMVAIEYEGHGLSDGLFGYMEDWNHVIDDVASYFTDVIQRNQFLQNKPTFLMGESMGGAIAYDVYHRIPHLFQSPSAKKGQDDDNGGSSSSSSSSSRAGDDGRKGGGVILVCPMCKISDEMMPSPIVIDCFKRLLEVCPWFGYLPIVPTKNDNLKHRQYKRQQQYNIASLSPLNYSRNPRLSTARELLDTTLRISDTFHEFDASFLILHGKDDVITDPLLSQQLYDESKSTDKTIYLYDDMWHSLLSGETEENIERIVHDILVWIQQRS